MQPGRAANVSSSGTPSFYVIGRQPIRPLAVMLALLVFGAACAGIGYGLRHSRKHHRVADTRASRAGDSPDDEEDKDDPSQVDVVYVGDAGDAPETTRPPGKRAYRSVHPTIMVRLPHSGPQEGLIPDDAAGHLLYRWLAAFNGANAAALAEAVPSDAPKPTVHTLLTLRQQTGGLRLLSAREVEPGVMVFRLQDQTPEAGEMLGTLRVRTGSAELGSFSLRAVPAAPAN